MKSPEEIHGVENIEFTTQLIMNSYDLEYGEARQWAIKALNGLESHGSGASDHKAVSEVVRVVVAAWLGKKPRV